MTQKTQLDTAEEGNTITSSVTDRSRKWCFTLNNYTDNEYKTLNTTFQSKKWTFVMGKETSSTGTPHIQGYIEHKNAIKFEVLKKIMPRAHIEKALGSTKDNLAYCTKEDSKAETNITIEKTMEEKWNDYMMIEYKDVVWKDWQQEILDIIPTPADRRTVNWFWEETGKAGKSFLSMFIDWKYKTCIINGKQADVFHSLKTFIDENNDWPEVVIADIPRYNEKYVCYGTLEKIKDGLMLSGKYESSKIRLKPLHLFVFANFEPITGLLSEDRWNVRQI